jgi:hypothetical protein
MIQTVSVSQFRDAFRSMGRGEQFSYEGLELLFDWLNNIDEHVELDVIGCCCDYAEDEPSAIASAYNIDVDGMSDDEIWAAVKNYLSNQGAFIGSTCDGFVYAQH